MTGPVARSRIAGARGVRSGFLDPIGHELLEPLLDRAADFVRLSGRDDQAATTQPS